jgi:hypothetical protein
MNQAHAQSFIVNANGEIAVIDQLIDREHGIIRLDKVSSGTEESHMNYSQLIHTSTTVSETFI